MDNGAKQFIVKAFFLGVMFYTILLILSFVLSHNFDWRSRQDPRKRVLYEAVSDNTGIILIGDSVWISAYVETEEETLWRVLEKMTGKHVFNATLNGAEEPDFKNIVKLLPNRGVESAFVFLNVNPTRILPRFSSEERPIGNYAGEFARLVGNNLLERAFVFIQKPILICNLDVLLNCIFTKNYFRVSDKWEKVREAEKSNKVREGDKWKKDRESIAKGFTSRFERHFTDTENFRKLDWIKELEVSLVKKGYRLVIVLTPINNYWIKEHVSKNKVQVIESRFSKVHDVLVRFLQEYRIEYIDCYRGFDTDYFVGLIHTDARGDRRMAEKMASYVTEYDN